MKSYEIISFHPGRQHNFDQAFQIAKEYKNFRHLTSLFISQKTAFKWGRFSKKIGEILKRRSFPIDKTFVHTYPVLEIMLLMKRSLNRKILPAQFKARNELFQQWVVKNYNPPKICVGFDTSSWIVFEKWKNKSFLILDLSIAIPQFKKKLGNDHNLDEDFMARQTKGDREMYSLYEKELELADLILCGSEFVKQSCLCLNVPNNKLLVLPYGVDLERFHNNSDNKKEGKVIKVVFVGTFGYRKGADIVLKSWESLSNKYPFVELHIYGSIQLAIPAHLQRIFSHGFVNQQQLAEELKTAHISILPTFFEGSSLAVYQSMAMGLAVVTTPNAGSIIDNNKNGIIIPYGSEEVLTNALEKLIQSPELRKKIGTQASEDVKEYSWENYGRKLRVILNAAYMGIDTADILVNDKSSKS